MSYHTFTGGAGCFEVFYATQADCVDLARPEIVQGLPEDERTTYQPGWYWWACFPGCLPDSDPVGPFQSENDATSNALEG
jgi:hypothetical protein